MKNQRTKRLPAVLLVLALCLGLLAGCGAGDAQQKEGAGNAEQPAREEPAAVEESPAAPAEESPEPETAALPDALPMDFVFASGAGAWSTVLTLNRDGTFTGVYHDADTTTVYICTFSGRFGDIRQVDDHTWSMTLEETVIEETPAPEWDEGELHYIASEPYGIEAGTEFLLYAPETPTAGLSQEFLSWWPSWNVEDNGTLGCWGLLNVEMGYGFFTYD